MICDVGKPLLILHHFHHFTYVTAHSPTLPSLYLRHSSFSNHSFASPTSQALHLRHLASRPWLMKILFIHFARYFNISNHHHCSAQGQVLHCKLRHQDCNSAHRQVFHCKLMKLGCSLLGMNRCGSFPLLSAPHSLFSIWTNLKRSENIPGAPRGGHESGFG